MFPILVALPFLFCDEHLMKKCNFFAFQFLLVMKTALKLLLVFVEYSEANALMLLEAIQYVDNLHSKDSV